MVQWYAKLFSGQILADSSFQQMVAIEPSSVYGLGVEEHYHNILGPIYYHSGALNAFVSYAYFDKKSKAAIFICFNNVDDYSYQPYLKTFFGVYKNEKPTVANDAGILTIVSPQAANCAASPTSVVTLKNYGTATLVSTNIVYRLDGGAANIYNWSGNLPSGNTEDVTLPTIATVNGTHTLTVYTTNPNSNIEGYNFNDTASFQFITSTASTHNGFFSESFEHGPAAINLWSNYQSKEAQWGITSLTSLTGSHSLSNPGYEDFSVGKVNYADMPEVHLATSSIPRLQFSYAYSPVEWGSDSLQVLVSNDCGNNWQSLFYKGGDNLGTAASTNLDFFPQTTAEWKTETFSLKEYTGDVLVRFRFYNANGNNIFLDDIVIDSFATVLPLRLLNFSAKVTSANSIQLDWLTTNEINTASFELQRSTDGNIFIPVAQLQAKGNAESQTSYNYSDLNLPPSLYYYRLLMKDMDGKQTYSQTETVLLKGNVAIAIYPVPAKDVVWLNSGNTSIIGQKILLMDMLGKTLQTMVIKELPQRIDISTLAKGMYLLKLDGETAIKMIKQ